MADNNDQIKAADAGIVSSGTGTKGPEERDLPESLKYDMDLCLRILRDVLGEFNPQLLESFDALRQNAVEASAEHFSDILTDPHPDEDGLAKAVALIDGTSMHDSQLLARAFTTYFHLANLCEENYRVAALHKRESEVDLNAATDPVNEMTGAYHQLIDEMGPAKAQELLEKLEFHPVFTAHPTEARRKAVEGKIRRVAELLEERPKLGGSDLEENERRLYNEIDALFRTSPIGLKKPTPVEESDTIIDIFDNTLFDTIPKVYRRFDDWILGKKAGRVEPVCPAFFHPGSWIGSDRDGNPNVTAKVSRMVARKFTDHVIFKLEQSTRTVGKNLTVESETTPPSSELLSLWSHQKEMSERLTDKASFISSQEPHRSVVLVIADRLHASILRDADLMYKSCDEFIEDLKVVQRSLAAANAPRHAYGPLQDLIWQAQTFGFHLVEMEFRQHSVVHARALEDIREHGLHGERGALQPMTHEVLDTFRALGSIQRRNGIKAARRYIISFTKSAQHVKDVFELNRLAFAHPKDVPTIDVIPLFEQLEDLENSVDTLEEIIKIPEVQARLKATGNKMEVMLGYSDSSKDAGPTSATLALHSAQERIAKWALSHDIDLTLFHGRGGAVGRGGGPANRAVLAQPVGSVNCRFKLTEQGEVIFARYGNPILAIRHIESVAAATLLQSAPSVEKRNTEMTQKYSQMAAALNEASHNRFLDLLGTPDFAPWFSIVTPLTEVGLLPIGSRPAKRGIGAKSLDDLRTIPWVFSWAQARINLAAWYGLGTACEQFNDLETMRLAYEEWPLFSTFIDNIEMSIAKTDERIAKMYLALGDRDDLAKKVLDEMELTRKWVLKIVGDKWPLQHRHVLGQAIRIRSPYVDALSVTQVRALRSLRRRNDKEELSTSQQADFIYLILCTVSGVAAGLQNTG
ncbi:phosphoenolpyruvate carboxylase [Bifidobacterium psychraerophilum]|jgi:phosphoenolpyruvate carboxylase|uniref:phosphoenolpyruvate carboxylase n=1 Tax=Bifidobacterium psychraerophilum TaxID=218140 RepID=UPI0023F158B8|nr:phosphoenolpyruvate carboxylase [Bifidobacterium psychraerophilum]MCI1659519.1 phosphoenolpyruvate carboxylase [Bifidobacterium psychraerophilum]MCI1804513.1 phosphoenolpyruvate carboxylase [Bifidobacterium psychraerophilum]MCI2176331.1 phosphoenolpyruvate carboxylase [Bifidobacterium psychraerophilum]MCI2181195.1 phosphoenolpyruvate carboxylase [Bifidobacterium psychraerophilum]